LGVVKSVALAGLSLLLLSMLATSCGGGGEGTTPGVTTPGQGGAQPGENELRQTAKEAQLTFIKGEADQAYAFFSSDYQARCPFEDFEKLLMAIQSVFGGQEDVEVIVEGVRFEGAKAFVDISVNGQDIDAGAESAPYPYYWIVENGTWKRTNDDPAPCRFPVATPLSPGQ